jgi:class 3 adenylate cyclase
MHFSALQGRKIILILFMMFVFAGASIARGEDYLPEPGLSRIVLNGDSAIIPEGTGEVVVPYDQNNVTFELSVPDSTILRFFLEGFDKDYGRWLETTFKEYTNLPAGTYRFRIQYIEKGSTAGEILLAQIRILPRWYFSYPAIAFYVIFTILLIWASYAFLNLRFARTQYMLEQIINKRTEDLIVEKEKTESLLANVLPKNTASEIMEKGKATKIKYNFVTVLFSDIQGFTRIAEEMNPEVLIDELDKFFFYFDSVVEKLGIEKIKTIGDAYMCAGGIPEKNRTNPVEVILAALEMKEYMKKLKESSELEGMKFWDIRIGIHTGTVVAGVVGQKKLSYDIWGDTVNTASRMESSGEAGKINISGTTYEFVKEFFICQHRGKMPVKYKGELDMYFVEGIVPELRDEQGRPNRSFMLKIQRIKIQDIEDLVMKMFDDEAPPNLYFHNSSLVRSICSQTDLLTTAGSLSEEDYITVRLAAIFLYTGYIADYDKPADGSGRYAGEILPRYGFDKELIEKVRKCISNSFEDISDGLIDDILHDARFDYLGRVDYLKLTEKLLREDAEYGNSHSRADWVMIQKKLLKEHDFRTETASLLRSVPAEEQIESLSVYNN